MSTALVTLVLVLVSVGAAAAGLRYLEVTVLAVAAGVVGYRIGIIRESGRH